jgi:hypothetical protein
VRRPQFFGSVTKDETGRALQEVEKNMPRLPAIPALRVRKERIDAIIHASTDELAAADVITLSDVTMLWSCGAGLKLPTMRLSLDAIAAWWVVPAVPVMAPKDSSGFWAVGVVF